MRDDFESVSQILIPSLLKISGQSKQIITSCAEGALRSILKNSNWSKILPIVHSNFNSKNAMIRKRCVECVEWALQDKQKNHYLSSSEISDIIFQSIKSGLADASSDVREATKGAYNALESCSKDHARSLYNTLDSTQQKRVASAKPSNSDNAPSKPWLKSGAAGAPEGAKRTKISSKPSLKELIKRDKAAKGSELSGRVELAATIVLAPSKNEDIVVVSKESAKRVLKPEKSFKAQRVVEAKSEEVVDTSLKTDLQHSIKSVSSDEWSVRLEAFEKVAKLLKREDLSSVVKKSDSIMEQITKIIFDHLQDPNFTVATAVMKTLDALIQSPLFSLTTLAPLDQWLVRLLKRSEDEKESLATATTKVLNRLSSLIPSLEIFPHLTKILEQNKQASLVAVTLQYLLSIVAEDKSEFFSSERNMKSILRICLQLCQEQSQISNIKEAVAATLIEFHTRYRKTFLRASSEMDNQSVFIVCKLIQFAVPDIRKQLAKVEKEIKQVDPNTSFDFSANSKQEQSENEWLVSENQEVEKFESLVQKENIMTEDIQVEPALTSEKSVVQVEKAMEKEAAVVKETNEEKKEENLPVETFQEIQNEVVMEEVIVPKEGPLQTNTQGKVGEVIEEKDVIVEEEPIALQQGEEVITIDGTNDLVLGVVEFNKDVNCISFLRRLSKGDESLQKLVEEASQSLYSNTVPTSLQTFFTSCLSFLSQDCAERKQAAYYMLEALFGSESSVKLISSHIRAFLSYFINSSASISPQHQRLFDLLSKSACSSKKTDLLLSTFSDILITSNKSSETSLHMLYVLLECAGETFSSQQASHSLVSWLIALAESDSKTRLRRLAVECLAKLLTSEENERKLLEGKQIQPVTKRLLQSFRNI